MLIQKVKKRNANVTANGRIGHIVQVCFPDGLVVTTLGVHPVKGQYRDRRTVSAVELLHPSFSTSQSNRSTLADYHHELSRLNTIPPLVIAKYYCHVIVMYQACSTHRRLGHIMEQCPCCIVIGPQGAPLMVTWPGMVQEGAGGVCSSYTSHRTGWNGSFVITWHCFWQSIARKKPLELVSCSQ